MVGHSVVVSFTHSRERRTLPSSASCSMQAQGSKVLPCSSMHCAFDWQPVIGGSWHRLSMQASPSNNPPSAAQSASAEHCFVSRSYSTEQPDTQPRASTLEAVMEAIRHL